MTLSLSAPDWACWATVKDYAHISLMLPLIAALGIQCYRRPRRWPTIQELVMLCGYGGALYGAAIILGRCIQMKAGEDGGFAWKLLMAGVIAAHAASKGVWDLFSSISREQPAQGVEPLPVPLTNVPSSPSANTPKT